MDTQAQSTAKRTIKGTKASCAGHNGDSKLQTRGSAEHVEISRVIIRENTKYMDLQNPREIFGH
jgi:hypothetical protein